MRTNESLDDFSEDRSNTDKIGGRDVEIAGNAVGVTTVGHEIGHAIGAGDQYKGGIGADGKKVESDVAGPANIMRDSGARSMNSQSLTEMMKAPTNTIRVCPGGLSSNG